MAIDVLRGLAVFTMVAANLAASVLVQPHPFGFRFYGSFAAPLFVLLSGMMVAYTTRSKGYGFRHFLARGLVLLAAAALSEVLVWHVYPFASIDVLYLIGVSLPLACLFPQLNKSARWMIVAGIFLCTPLFQQAFGYTDYPTQIYLSGEPAVVPQHPTSIANHWFVDGWFPLFPWLGFALLGVQLSGLRPLEPERRRTWTARTLPVGVVVLACGIGLWWLSPDGFLTREGYSEVFYPPTPGYWITAIGLILLLFTAVDRNADSPLTRPLRLLGESALFLYLLHFVLIKYLFAPLWENTSFSTFVVLYFGLVGVLLAIAYALRKLKSMWRHPPFALRVLLGS